MAICKEVSKYLLTHIMNNASYQLYPTAQGRTEYAGSVTEY